MLNKQVENEEMIRESNLKQETKINKGAVKWGINLKPLTTQDTKEGE